MKIGLATDRAVGGFDFLISRLVAELNATLCTSRGWVIISGFSIKVNPGERSRDNVRIFPVDWRKDSFISARVDKYDNDNHWHPIRGTITTSQMGEGLKHLSFDVHDAPYGRGIYRMQITLTSDVVDLPRRAIA